MDAMNEDTKPADDKEASKQEAPACGPGCGCNAGPSNRMRLMAGVVMSVAVAVLAARAVMKNNRVSRESASTGFAALLAPDSAQGAVAPDAPPETADAKEAAVALSNLGAISDLNSVAADMIGVFVFLPGKGEGGASAPAAQMRDAARKIETQLRGRIGMFALKTDSPDYEQIARQMDVPGVLAMVKGGGMSAASGDITEGKLIQAFVGASSFGGGCGPSGCGPRGCN